MESGVNNLLIPDFLEVISKLDIHVFALSDDATARKIEVNDNAISHLQFVDLCIASQRIINWF